MAIFNPIPTFPISGEGIDSTLVNRITWDFVSTGNEPQDSYRILIYNISDTSTAVHDSGIVMSSSEYYDLPANTLSNGIDYVWKVNIVSFGNERTNNSFAHFKTLQTPTLTIDTIGSVGQFHTFTATYNQAQGVNVKTYQWTLYDNNDTVLEVGELKFGVPITQTFRGFDNNTTYKIDVTVVNQNNVTTTSTRQSFITSFTIPQDTPNINVTPRPDRTAIEVDWSSVVQLVGEVVGTFEYVDGKFNRSLKLTDACLNVNLINYPIPMNFTVSFWIKLDSSHNGDFWRIKKNNDVRFRVGYDSTLRRFYYERNYRYVYSNQLYELPDDYLLVGINSEGVYIRTLWQSTWQKISPTQQGLDWNQLYKDRQVWIENKSWNELPTGNWLNFAQTYENWHSLSNNTFSLSIR